MNICLKLIFICMLLPHCKTQCFEKVVIWGHKLHSHTHSYIHNGFFVAFKHLGYPTYWFDDKDDVSNFDFSNSLFLTEGQVDERIPLRDDCQYILHYCRTTKYDHLIANRQCVTMQVYNNALYNFNADGSPIPGSQPDRSTLINFDPCVLLDPIGKRVYMPWATDLLPHEIEQIQKELPTIHRGKTIYWVGSIGGGAFGNGKEIDAFKNAAAQHRIKFIHKDPWSKGISPEENLKLIQKSYIAPAIVGQWQNQVGYIPCRIFKNISYGQMGVTNSATVQELFQGKLIFNTDTYQLFNDAEDRLRTFPLTEVYELMDIVKNHHTYVNRINAILKLFELIQQK